MIVLTSVAVAEVSVDSVACVAVATALLVLVLVLQVVVVLLLVLVLVPPVVMVEEVEATAAADTVLPRFRPFLPFAVLILVVVVLVPVVIEVIEVIECDVAATSEAGLDLVVGTTADTTTAVSFGRRRALRRCGLSIPGFILQMKMMMKKMMYCWCQSVKQSSNTIYSSLEYGMLYIHQSAVAAFVGTEQIGPVLRYMTSSVE